MQKKLNIQSDTHADAPPKFFDEPPAWADEREPIIQRTNNSSWGHSI